MDRRKEQRVPGTTKYFDYTLLFLILFMLGFGLILLYSTSSYESMNKFQYSTYYFNKQVRNIAIGLALMVAGTLIDYHFWRRISKLLYGATFLLCVAVPFVGVDHNGSKRWLEIPGTGIEFQPSEIAKITIILLMAYWISRNPGALGNRKKYAKLVILVIPIAGIVAATNLSTGIIIACIALCMLLVAGPKTRYFWHWIFLGVAAAAALTIVQGYRSTRFLVWLHPENYSKGYQTLQGLYAIGSGGLFGKGLGESMQKLGYVPEAQNDMIFTIICEELGLFGAICIFALFGLMLWRFVMIACNAKDLFGSLIAVGAFVHISLQVILNVAVVTNTIPNTGIILPFFSYGGTSLCFLLAEMGIVLNVSRQIRLQEK